MTESVIVKLNGKDHKATTTGIGRYELHYFRIWGRLIGLGQLEVCVDRHKTILGLKLDNFCKQFSPLTIQVIGWRVSSFDTEK